MVWCTSQEVEALVYESRINPAASQASRAEADAQLRQLLEGGVNVGDALVDVVTQASRCAEVRFACALMLEGRMGRKAWLSSESFHDKDAAARKLWGALSEPVSISATTLARKLVESICVSLAKICAAEFPTKEWQTALVRIVLRSEAGGAALGWAESLLLEKVMDEAHENATLWFWLANDACQELLKLEQQSSAMAGPVAGTSCQPPPGSQSLICRYLLPLLNRKPRLDNCVASVSATPSTTVLCSEAHATYRLGVLHSVFDVVMNELTGPLTPVACADAFPAMRVAYDQLLILGKLQLRDSLDLQALQLCFRFLTSFKDTYFTLTMDTKQTESGEWCALLRLRYEWLVRLVEAVLELSQGILQSSPERALGTDWLSDSLLPTVLTYMIDPEEVKGDAMDDATAGAALVDQLIDEESIPLGCASGSAVETVSAVLELLLEKHFDALFVPVCTSFVQLVGKFRGAVPALWSALTRALQSLCSIAAEGELPLVDLVPEETAASFLEQLYSQLQCSVAYPLLSGRLLYVFGLAIRLTSQQSLATKALTMAATLAGLNRGERASVINTMAVYVACQILGDGGPLRGQDGHGGDSALVGVSLWVTATGGALGALCGARTLLGLLAVRPDLTRAEVLGNSAQLSAVVEGLCCCSLHCSYGVLLQDLLLRLFADHDPAARHCDVIAGLTNVIATRYLGTGDLKPVLTRSVLELITAVSLRELTGAATGCTCHATLGPPVASYVLNYTLSDGPHDEASTRALAKCLGTCVVTGIVNPSQCAVALVRLGEASVVSGHASNTLSTVGVALGLTMLQAASVVDDTALLVEWAGVIVRAARRSGRKGMSFAGCCLPLALALIRNPSLLWLQSVATAWRLSNDDRHVFMGAIGIWSSVAVHGDHFCMMYSMIAWSRIVQLAQTGGVPAAAAAPECVVFCISQPHIRDAIETIPQVSGSPLFGVAAGLTFATKHAQKGSKVKCFDGNVLAAVGVGRGAERLAATSLEAEPQTLMILTTDIGSAAATLLGALSELPSFGPSGDDRAALARLMALLGGGL